MPRATWNGTLIAEAPRAQCRTVEDNIYFPADSLVREHFKPSDTTTVCGWKGVAHYYTVVAGGENRDAAWYYPDPKPAADEIRGMVAFWHGVDVEDQPD